MNEKIEFVKEWVDKADHDLGSAKLIFTHLPGYFDTISFHCQQAVEKYLKSILVFNDLDFQRTHNLVYLLDLLSEKVTIDESRYDKAILLNGYSVQIRYPDKTIVLTKEELETSIGLIEK
jgi:HEPN domain-containing protein